MTIVLSHQVARVPDAIGILRCADSILRHATVASHWGMDDPVLELDLAIVDSQRLEKLRFLAGGRVDGHYVEIKVTKIWNGIKSQL